MATTRQTRSNLWFLFALGVMLYLLASAGIAVATADTCDAGYGGVKSWQPLPPHWECGVR